MILRFMIGARSLHIRNFGYTYNVTPQHTFSSSAKPAPAPAPASFNSKNRQPGERFVDGEELYKPPVSAMELINEIPIKEVHDHVVACDGGGGPLGHPRVFLNLDRAGEVSVCGYCGLRFVHKPHHHH